VAAPVHVPVSDAFDALPGEVGEPELPPHAAASKPSSDVIISIFRIGYLPQLQRFLIPRIRYANHPPGGILGDRRSDMRTPRLTVIFCAAFLLIAFVSAAQTTQTPPATQPHQHGQAQQPSAKPGMQGMHGKMTMDCQQMMQMHQKMMQDMQAMDSRLDTLVQQMNSATGQAKVDGTAAVVSELVAQRKQMREGMSTMQGQMMQHMAEHMQSGGSAGMMNCPMMKDMQKGGAH
jgi:hypothetical protein